MVMVDVVQSHWASLAAAATVFDAVAFGATTVAFEPMVLAEGVPLLAHGSWGLF
jgi:hypothetical protein